MRKNTFLILAVVYFMFFALGLPDGAFGVAWPIMRYEMRQPLEMAGFIVVLHSMFYSLASGLLGRFTRYLKLEKINLLGGFMMVVGFFGMAIAPSFTVLLYTVFFTGVGMGLVDSSFNSYMAKSFSSRYMNWLHCFWGFGAMVSPIIMTNAINASGWRAGYASIATVQLVAIVVVLFSLAKGIWAREEIAQAADEPKGGRLHKKRHQFIAILICFVYGGIEYSIGFWSTSVMMESRGLTHAQAAMFPAVYYGFMMGGRVLVGFLANRFSDLAIIRVCLSVAVVGAGLLLFSNSIVGVALIGFGFAPFIPCFVNGTSNLFKAKLLTQLVGYEFAAVGAGVAIISFAMGQVLSHVSLEALFPIVLGLTIVVLVLNEILEGSSSSQKTKTA